MRIFRSLFILLGILWAIAGLLVVWDVAGPFLGTPPTTATATAKPGANPGSSSGSPGVTRPGGPNNSTTKSSTSSTSGGGLLYPYTKNIPAAVATTYRTFHWFYFPVPLVASFLVVRKIRRMKKAQTARVAQVSRESVTIEISPPPADNTNWEDTAGLLSSLYSIFASLPQCQAKPRQAGNGLHFSLGMISRVGYGTQLTARLPAPIPASAKAKAELKPDLPKSHKSRPSSKSKSKSSQKAEQLKAIPDGLPAELVSLILSEYEWCQLSTLAVGEDTLNLDQYDNPRYTQRKQSIAAASGSSGGVVRRWELLGLAAPPHLPIKTDFGKANDPTKLLYQKLNLASDSSILACGIEFVLVPATEWRKDAQLALRLAQAEALSSGAASRQAMRPNPKAGVGMKLPLGMGKGRGAGNAQGAASSQLAGKAAQDRAARIAEKLTDPASFASFIYIWAEGSELSVTRRLDQLRNALATQYNLATSGIDAGNSFTVLKQGEGLAEVLGRKFDPYFIPEPNVLSAKELSCLWHLPNGKVAANSVRRAGAMSPPPEEDVIHTVILPSGERLVSDSTWRRVIGTYQLPDGTVYEVGITEQGCLRGSVCTGRPGSGKSVDIMTNVLQDLTRDDRANVGKGGSSRPTNSVVVVDPNQDLAMDLAARIPDEQEGLVCFVNPLDTEWIVGINPMEIPDGLDGEALNEMLLASQAGSRTLSPEIQREIDRAMEELLDGVAMETRSGVAGAVAASMLEVFGRTQGVDMDKTPNIYRIIANAVRLAVESDANSTIWTLMRLITDSNYREALVATSTDRIAADFWATDFPNLADKAGGSALTPTKNRLEALLRQEVVRRLFGQRRSTVNLRKMIDTGQIVIFSFSPELGKDKPFLLALCFNFIKQAVFSRANIHISKRRVTGVYLDEFQEMVGADAASLQLWLEQARKYGGAVFLGHQNLDQVGPLIKPIKGNVGNVIPMLVGKDDRDYYADLLDSPQWPKEQIAQTFNKLPRYSKIARLYDNGQDHTPVLLNSLPFPKPLANNYAPLLVAITSGKTGNKATGDANFTSSSSSSENRSGKDKGEYWWGYRLEEYDEAKHKEALEYEVGTDGSMPKVRATIPSMCKGLVEALTRYLYEQRLLTWGLRPPDYREAELMGLSRQELKALNADPAALAECHRLLLDIEALPPKEREAYLASDEVDNRTWQLYRASRYGRNLALRELILANKGFIPHKRDRVITLSNLRFATPVPEIEAESQRPDAFSAQAEEIRRVRAEEAALAEEAEAMLKPKRKQAAKKAG